MQVNVVLGALLVCVFGLLGTSAYLGVWVARLLEQERRWAARVRACDEARSQAAREQEMELERRQNEQQRLEAEWASEREALEKKIAWIHKSNAEFAHHQEEYIAALDAEQGVAQALRQQLSALSQDMVLLKRHTVLLDGISGAGKTTLLERLTNPAATRADLANIAATAMAQLTAPVPLCWELVDGRRVLHTLEFYDVGGENPGQVVDNIAEFVERQNDPEAEGQAIVLVIWNSEAELEADPKFWNTDKLNPARLAATYATRNAKNAIRSFVFFMNKIDRVRARLADQQMEHEFDQFLARQHQRLQDEVYKKALSHYPAPELAVGSAVDGSGVHDCLGAILRQLGLDRLYPSRTR